MHGGLPTVAYRLRTGGGKYPFIAILFILLRRVEDRNDTSQRFYDLFVNSAFFTLMSSG